MPSKKPSRLTLAHHQLSGDDRRATSSPFPLTDAQRPSKGSTRLPMFPLGSLQLHSLRLHVGRPFRAVHRGRPDRLECYMCCIYRGKIFQTHNADWGKKTFSNVLTVLGSAGYEHVWTQLLSSLCYHGKLFQLVIKDSYIHPSRIPFVFTSKKESHKYKLAERTISKLPQFCWLMLLAQFWLFLLFGARLFFFVFFNFGFHLWSEPH